MFRRIAGRKIAVVALGLILMSSIAGQAFAFQCMKRPDGTVVDCYKECKSKGFINYFSCF